MGEDLPTTTSGGGDGGVEGPPEKPSVTIIEGKYRIFNRQVVGEGALSTVKKCEPIFPYIPPVMSERMKFVVKEIDKAFLTSIASGVAEHATAQVKREVQILQNIPPHENIATFVEYIETPTLHLLFFEEVQCGDLCEILLRTESRRLPEEKAKRYVYQIIKAVLHCHLHDVCHRDIKPENLLLSEDDNLKLTDFGLAKHVKGVCTGETDTDTNTNLNSSASLMMPYPGCERLSGKKLHCWEVVGTPRYGAPEMFYAKLTQKSYDGFKADTWGIGVVTFILLTGSFPFGTVVPGDDKQQFDTIMKQHSIPHSKSLSPLAIDFIERMLTKDPEERIELFQFLDHPWLADVVEPRKSIAASLIRRRASEHPDVLYGKNDLLLSCEQCDAEVEGYQRCLANLRWRIMELTAKKSLEEKQSAPYRGETSPKKGGAASAGRSSVTASSASTHMRATTPRPTSTMSSSYMVHDRAATPGPSSFNSRPCNTSPARRSVLTPSTRTSGSFSTVSKECTPGRRSTAREGSAVRRETPVKAGMMGSRALGTSSFGGASPSRGPSLSSLATGSAGSSFARPSRLVSPTPRGSTPSRGLGGATTRDSTVASVTAAPRTAATRASAPVPGRGSSLAPSRLAGTRGTLPKDLCVGDEVLYKGLRAAVRFNGSTDFGTGTWIGLELLEGNGVNDGYSFVDKKSYFCCPKGKGVFARAFQLTKVK